MSEWRGGIIGGVEGPENRFPRHPVGSGMPRWGFVVLAAATAALLLCGAFLRFYHVGQKAFWIDECIATLRIVGVTEREIVVAAGSLKTMGELHRMLHPVTLSRPASATIASLRTEDPQHPPLYYLIARGWALKFGDSIPALRVLSAFIGVLAIPCMYWLCVELYQRRSAGWAGATLAAVSPVALLYSQEIREYGLWLVATLVSSALLIRLLRRTSVMALALYAGSVASALYVFPAAAFVVAAHALVIVLGESALRDKVRALAAQLAGILAFMPWLVVIGSSTAHIDEEMAPFTQMESTPGHVARMALAVVRVNMLDLNGEHRQVVYGVGLLLVALCAYAVYSLRRHAPPASRLFVWVMIPCVSLPFIILDVMHGGQRTWQIRYFIPLFVAIDVALVALLVAKLRPEGNSGARPVWAGVFALVLVARLVSCAASAQAGTWWSKNNFRPVELATRIEAAQRPLILSDSFIIYSLVLSEYLGPETPMVLQPLCYTCFLPAPDPIDLAAALRPDEVRDVFLLSPSDRQRRAAETYWRQASPAARYHCVHVREGCTGAWSFF